MPGFLAVLPLAIVMVAGPQIVSSIFLATSIGWRRNSAAFLAGALASITLFVTAAYVISGLLKEIPSDSSEGAAGTVIDVLIVALLLLGAIHVFRNRTETEPQKWMGKLTTATPGLSFKLGFLLLGVFPTDIITSTSVGTYLARHGEPWWYCAPRLSLSRYFYWHCQRSLSSS